MRNVIPSCWVYGTFPLASLQETLPIKKKGPKSPRTCFQTHFNLQFSKLQTTVFFFWIEFWKNSPTFCFADSRIRWEPHSAKWGGSRCRPQIYAFKLTYSLQQKRKFIFQPAIWGVTVSLREGNPNKTWQATFKMSIGHFHQQLESSKLLKSKHKLKTFLEVSLQNQQEF